MAKEPEIDLTDSAPDLRCRSVLITYDPSSDEWDLQLFNMFDHELPGAFREILSRIYDDPIDFDPE